MRHRGDLANLNVQPVCRYTGRRRAYNFNPYSLLLYLKKKVGANANVGA